MNKHEFSALQITVLVKTEQGGGTQVKEFFDSVPFQYQLQDAVGNLLKDQLKKGEIDFNEVIITMDDPAQNAKKVRQKSSLMGRLLGKA